MARESLNKNRLLMHHASIMAYSINSGHNSWSFGNVSVQETGSSDGAERSSLETVSHLQLLIE